MKKLYNRKGKVHPTPPVVSDHFLSFLPAAILTLTVALSAEDKEVLAYLISCSSYYSSANFSNDNHRNKTTSTEGGADHPQCFSCNCFRCYMRYWVKWDSSVNRQLIHEIIDAFEDSLLNLNESKKLKKNKRERRKGKSVKVDKIKILGMDESNLVNNVNEDLLSFTESNSNSGADVFVEDVEDEEDDDDDNVDEDEFEKGSIRRFVSFVGERIWSVWG